MKLSLVQFCPEFGNTEANRRKIRTLAESIASDIVVFPELSTSGYFFSSRDEALKFGEPADSGFIREVQEIATEKQKTVVFGFAETEGSELYNSAAILMPDKKQSRIYRKTHLFYRERFIFDEGNSGFFVIDDQDRDIRIGTMICYDWRFPEASRTLGMLGADLVVCPSNLVTHIWPKVMPARAIENKVYLAVPNRFGSETANGESVSFNGMSGIWSYNGDLMAQADRVGESVITADIEPSKTRDKSFNEFNDIIKDRRPKYYKI
jgi:predicted amidohydrolase